MDKIVKAAGYSNKEEEYNPAIKDFVNAFKDYKKKSRSKKMKPKFLDYVAFLFIAIGIIFLIIGLSDVTVFITGWIFIVAGMVTSFISSGLSE
ncbi:MAG: hypothetical protein FE045_00045 [Thermoplasmata archaeon]|nr:MAG: hypothetical protein FE045_00045 [Thermoplasmata archaeon]